MALSTARIHRVRGRPPLLAAGIRSLIHSHSSLVRSLGYIFSFIYPFYTTHEDFSDRLLDAAGDTQARPRGDRHASPWLDDTVRLTQRWCGLSILSHGSPQSCTEVRCRP